MAAKLVNEPPAPAPHVDPAYPHIQRWDNGLVLYNEFITEEEEAAILEAIVSDEHWAGRGKRLTRHYGSYFDYTTSGVSKTPATPPPSYLTSLLPRLAIQDDLPNQFTVQYYPPGAGIPPHTDTHSAFHEAIYSLSLGSAVPMCFKKCDAGDARRVRKPKRSILSTSSTTPTKTPSTRKNLAEHNNKSLNDEDNACAPVERWELVLPPRSLLLMMGPSRYGFTHQIRGRSSDLREGRMFAREDRYSITMRTIKIGDQIGCTCDFPEVCDARIKEDSLDVII